MNFLTPDLPDDLTSLGSDEITTMLSGLREIFSRIRSSDRELIGDRDHDTVLAEATRVVEQIETLRAELRRRIDEKAAADKLASAVESMAAAALADDPTMPADEHEPDHDDNDDHDKSDHDKDDEEAEAEAEDEAMVAGGARRVPPVSDENLPREQRVSLTAAADIPGFASGGSIDSRDALVAAFMSRYRSLGRAASQSGPHYIPVAQARAEFPNERVLGDDPSRNGRLIESVVSRDALVASGGLCAPVSPYYDLFLLGDDWRPVRDSLPAFRADRGGIRFVRPPQMTSFLPAVSYITEAEDAAGPPTSTKDCMRVVCPPEQEVRLNIVSRCLIFGNLGTRAFPEQVDNAIENTMIAHARVAETALLDAISAASTATTAANLAANYGATGSLIGQIITAAAAMRSRHRMRYDANLRVLLPQWTPDLIGTDVMREQFARFDSGKLVLEQKLREHNIFPVWYADSATGAGQVAGPQAAGPLNGFPTNVVWYLFPEGSFLFLDGGTLDLGLVRDSVLNADNDYQIFSETFEALAFVGIESIQVTSSVCASGATTDPVGVTCPVV